MVAVQNLALSTVATPPSPATSGTSLVLQLGEGSRFANPATAGPYPVTLWPSGAAPTPSNAEIATVTARSADTLTIVRGQEGTTAQTVAAGWYVAATVTAGLLDTVYARSAGEYSIDKYGGDPTGAADSAAAWNAAIAAMPTRRVYETPLTSSGAFADLPVGVLRLSAGKYKLGSTATATTNLGPFVSVVGAGKAVTTLDYRGTGSCVRAYNPVRPSSDTFDTLGGLATKLDGFTIDGTNAGAGASGLRYGDMEGGVIGPDLEVKNFTGAGSVGLLFDNQVSWTENIRAWVSVTNCTTCVVFNGCGGSAVHGSYVGGDNSFMYSDINVKLYAFAGQDGVVFQNGATYQGGRLGISANMANAGSLPSNALLTLTGTGTAGHIGAGVASNISNSFVAVMAEANGPGSFGPMTIKLGSVSAFPANAIYNCNGILAFSNGTWTPSNWSLDNSYAIGNIQFFGTIFGDVNLNPGNGVGSTQTMYLPGTILFSDGGFPTNTGDIAKPLVLSQNITVNFQQVRAAPQRKIVTIQQAASGGPYTVTWPHSATPTTSSVRVEWPGGTAPTMTATANAKDVYELITYDGATWYGRVIGQNVS